MPAVGEHLTAIYYVDQDIYNSVGESSLLRQDLDEKLKIQKQDFVIFFLV